MKVTIVQENIRLDELVFKHYGSLKYFDDVLNANEQIALKPVLELGDIIELPVYEDTQAKIIEAKSLWD